MGVGVSEVVDVAAVRRVGGVSDGVAAEEGQFAKRWSEGPVGERGIRALP